VAAWALATVVVYYLDGWDGMPSGGLQAAGMCALFFICAETAARGHHAWKRRQRERNAS
jgi:hypothetical protein